MKNRGQKVLLLLLRDGPGCYHCGRSKDEEWRYTIDHLCPQDRGGTDCLANLVLSCFDCNNGKGTNYSQRDFETAKRLREFHKSIGFGYDTDSERQKPLSQEQLEEMIAKLSTLQ